MKGIGEALAVYVAAGVFCLASFRIGMGYGQLSVCEVPEGYSFFETISKDIYKANFKTIEADSLCGSEFVDRLKSADYANQLTTTAK